MIPADKTLLLICEEGEEEYDSERFAFGGVTVATIEDKAELNREHLQQLAEKSDCGRVIIEYNGMWLVQELYDALPDNWLIYQCLGHRRRHYHQDLCQRQCHARPAAGQAARQRAAGGEPCRGGKR